MGANGLLQDLKGDDHRLEVAVFAAKVSQIHKDEEFACGRPCRAAALSDCARRTGGRGARVFPHLQGHSPPQSYP